MVKRAAVPLAFDPHRCILIWTRFRQAGHSIVMRTQGRHPICPNLHAVSDFCDAERRIRDVQATVRCVESCSDRIGEAKRALTGCTLAPSALRRRHPVLTSTPSQLSAWIAARKRRPPRYMRHADRRITCSYKDPFSISTPVEMTATSIVDRAWTPPSFWDTFD